MVRLFRWLSRIVTTLVVLAALAATTLYWFASRSLPDYNERLSVSGIDAPVEIVRDNANVPHVFGTTDHDVYFGLGLAHAQDRLWQMLILRRKAQGRLSELYGLETLADDALMRRLGLYSVAVASVKAQSPYTMAAAEAYAEGVNTWLEKVNEGARGRGAPEFWVFSPQIAPWDPADSIAILKLLAFEMTQHISAEVLRARISLLLPEERTRDILPDTPGPGTAALPEYAELFPGSPQGTHFAAMPTNPYATGKPRPFVGASNAWAAAPDRSAKSGTLLANDPHSVLTAPSRWYLARLELESGGVIGATIPGVPAILAGRSSAVGWGITASYADDQDVFIEKLNPDNSEEVLTPDGWRRLRTQTSTVQVADGTPQPLTLRWSENGPILTGEQFGLQGVTPPGHVASIAWTGLSTTDTTLSALHDLNRAGDLNAALTAGRSFIAPSLNLVLADGERIAQKAVGAMPSRATDHDTQGRLPSPGWLTKNRWQGRLDYAENPEFIDPEGGILGNTNNKVLERPFPNHMSYSWGDTQRVQRWRRLMQSREVHTRESFIEAQLDTVSVTARTLLPLVGKDLWFTGEAAAEGTPERKRRDALDLLAEWNGEMNEHLPEPLIYSAWMRALQNRLIRDELGPLADQFVHTEPVFLERVFRDRDGAAAWCDVIQSAPDETCSDMARIALDDALIWIDERYGQAFESLRWGDAHEAIHLHEGLGQVPWFSWLVNIHQSTSGGDNTLQRGLTLGHGANPFQNVHAAGYRGVYDFADPDSSVFIISTGQSGHPFSRHYDDLGELWRRGEYIPMTLDPALARAGAVGITRLEPR